MQVSQIAKDSESTLLGGNCWPHGSSQHEPHRILAGVRGPAAWCAQWEGITHSTVETRVFARSRPNQGSELSTNELLWFAMPNPWSWAVPRSFVLQTANEPVRKAKAQQLETGLNGNKPKVSQYYCISFGMKGKGNL